MECVLVVGRRPKDEVQMLCDSTVLDDIDVK